MASECGLSEFTWAVAEMSKLFNELSLLVELVDSLFRVRRVGVSLRDENIAVWRHQHVVRLEAAFVDRPTFLPDRHE